MHRLGIALVLITSLHSIALAQPAEPAQPPEEPPATPPAEPATPATPPETKPAEPPAPPPKPVTPPPVKTVVVTPAPAPAPAEPEKKKDDWTMRAGGYVQPQFRVRQNSAATNDEDGFRLARARLSATAEGAFDAYKLSAYIEAELQPTFSLADAYATISRPLSKDGGVLTLDMGQTRVPISRQQLISDTRLSFVDKAQLATIAPDRDLGARAWFVPPGLEHVRLIAGAFNGDGKNQVQNLNEGYLYAGRLEVTPLGHSQPYAESSFSEPFVSAGISVGHNKLTPGNHTENQLFLGADISAAWNGLSGSVEFLQVRHTFSGDQANLPGPNYHAQGWMAQLAYLFDHHFEIAARVEQIDRNDAVPVAKLADPTQTVREYTGAISAYLRKHTCKAQLAFNHFQELETQTYGMYSNDQVVLQITYRVE